MNRLDESLLYPPYEETKQPSEGCCAAIYHFLFTRSISQQASDRTSSISSRRSTISILSTTSSPPYNHFVDQPDISEETKLALRRECIDTSSRHTLKKTIEQYIKINAFLVREQDSYSYIPIVTDAIACFVLLPHKIIDDAIQLIEIEPEELEGLTYHEKFDRVNSAVRELHEQLIV